MIFIREDNAQLSDSITVRPARETDIPQLVVLMNNQYARKKNGSYFVWQYFASYYPAILMCAFQDTELVGMFGVQKKELNNGVIVGQATDLLVSPAWRRRGVFTMLGQRATSYFRKLDVICVLPNQNGRNACENAFGWKTVGKIDSVILRENSFGNPHRELSAPERERKKKDLARFKYDSGVRAWRFDRHPDYNYEYINLLSGEFAVVKRFTDPLTGDCFGDIVDVECDLNNPDRIRELFVQSIMNLKERNISGITSWALPHTLLRSVVEDLGFVVVPQERYFCLDVLRNEFNYLYDLSNWHLVQADSEIY
jgi:GNAT superfamily N-acetyltransferase